MIKIDDIFDFDYTYDEGAADTSLELTLINGEKLFYDKDTLIDFTDKNDCLRVQYAHKTKKGIYKLVNNVIPIERISSYSVIMDIKNKEDNSNV